MKLFLAHTRMVFVGCIWKNKSGWFTTIPATGDARHDVTVLNSYRRSIAKDSGTEKVLFIKNIYPLDKKLGT
jgi:hypothetical protein